MSAVIRCLALAVALAASPAIAATAAKGRTMQEVLEASQPGDWRALDPENTLYLDLAGGRVVIELAQAYAPLHAANLRTLAHAHYFDGLAILRVQDNFVTQWGDPDAEDKDKARGLGKAARTLAPEFERGIAKDLAFTRLPDGDVYAPEVGFSGGMPVGREPKAGQTRRAPGYGMVGAGRDNRGDTGRGAEHKVG
ncbi:MAG: peptidylprolyl isomerase, partial [Dokdonella sp.]|uniref:peptidylprolyl isomerase n=1 Tax=Dokdonella sp. TaxID=2291710 RepID=UPI003F7DCEF9